MREPSSRAVLLWCTVWSTAFGLAEGAVVVYLRALFYPDGFEFPLRALHTPIHGVEIAREAATLVMLLGVACLAARGGMRRFAAFSLCFGVWDIVYYVALWVFLDWPPSLLTWDILFLVPRPWTAPVLAPVLVSLALVATGALVLAEPAGRDWRFLRPRDWAVEIAAGLVIIGSFLWNDAVIAAGGAPVDYPWWLFLLGWGGGVAWFAWRWRAGAAT